MRLLDRYICREVATHSLLGLAVFTFVLFVPQLVTLMDLIVRHSSGLPTILLLFLCTLPPVLAFTLPMSVLVGVLIGLGRMSADSEIVALHASGISLRRLLRPIGFTALVVALITLLMTFWLSPAALRTVSKLETRILASEAPYAIQPRVFDERFPRFVLYVQDVPAGAALWKGVFLAGSNSSGASSITLAQDAQIVSGPGPNQIQLHLGPGTTDEYDPRRPNVYDVTSFGTSDLPIDLSAVVAARNVPASPRERSTLQLLTDHGPGWREARVELQHRIAFPAAAIVFALLGVPLGVRPRRGGRAAGLVLTIVLIGCYYLLFVYGDHMAVQGRISPFWGVWSANIVTAAFGLAFLQRIETVRQQSRVTAWFDSVWFQLRRRGHTAPRTSPVKTSGGAAVIPMRPSAGQLIRRSQRIERMLGFPLIVDTYLLQRFLYYFFGLLASFVLISDAFTLFDLLGDITKNHVSVLVVINYFRFLVPFMTYTLAPLAALVATLITLATLAKNNEVVAFKASGISLYRLIFPLAIAACLVSAGMFLLSETYLPYANKRQDALRSQIKGKPPQTFFQPTRQWIFGENGKIYNYGLFDPVKQLFGNLTVLEIDPSNFTLRRRVFADRATWDPAQNTWVLTGGWVRDFSGGRVSSYVPFKATSLPELTEPPTYFRREVLASDQMSWRQLRDYIDGLQKAGFDTSRLTVQWYEKLSYPMIAAIIVLLAAPFAFLVGTRGAIGGLAMAVAIGIAYRAVSALLESMGTAGLLPALLAGWSSDAIFTFLAVYFFLRMPT
jgi:LPS export ABC transporter permease LptF/LPS export ABC transporter permease LptG